VTGMPQRSPDRVAIEAEIDRVRSLGLDALRSLWRTTFRSRPPLAFTKDLMARFLCWHIQEQALGGLDARTAKPTSMGRLTLNVLLSVAQFEREVTSERIRDKIVEAMASVAGAWTSGARFERTLVSLGETAASSSTSIALRPFLVMRSAIGPVSSSRRQTGSDPPPRTSSSKPARMSLSTTFRAASPLTIAGSSAPRSSRCEAADRMTSCPF
jgi:Protein of unknown function (DUF2924)